MKLLEKYRKKLTKEQSNTYDYFDDDIFDTVIELETLEIEDMAEELNMSVGDHLFFC